MGLWGCSRSLHVSKLVWCLIPHSMPAPAWHHVPVFPPQHLPQHPPRRLPPPALPPAHTWGPQIFSLAVPAFIRFIYFEKEWDWSLSLCIINSQTQGRVINNLFCWQFQLVSFLFQVLVSSAILSPASLMLSIQSGMTTRMSLILVWHTRVSTQPETQRSLPWEVRFNNSELHVIGHPSTK